MSWMRPISPVAMGLARDCLRRGGSLIEAATLIGRGRAELDLALWRTMGRNL